MSSNPPTPANCVSLTLTAKHLNACLTYLPLYKRLVHGDLFVVVDMALKGHIPRGADGSLDASWSAIALAALESTLAQTANDLGYAALRARPESAELDIVPDSDTRTDVPRASALRELVALITYAFTGPSAEAGQPSSLCERVQFNEDGTATMKLSWFEALYLSDAAEFFVRLGLGQLEFLAEAVLAGEIPPSAAVRQSHSFDFSRGHLFGDKLRALKPMIGHFASGSYGLGHPRVSEAVHLAWELRKEIQLKQALFRDPNPPFKGVNYDGNILRYTNEPLPEVVVLDM